MRAKGGVGDCLTPPRHRAPRRVAERDQPCLIASYRTRPERRLGAGGVDAGMQGGGMRIRLFGTVAQRS